MPKAKLMESELEVYQQTVHARTGCHCAILRWTGSARHVCLVSDKLTPLTAGHRRRRSGDMDNSILIRSCRGPF